MKAIVMRAILALVLIAATAAGAAEPELMAALSVMGYGYTVKVLVNGTDIGIQGGKSEARRLFNKDHPLKAKASPNLREHNFPLVNGTNELTIEYAKIDPKSPDSLEIVLEAEDYPEPLLKFSSRAKASDRLTLKLAIEPKAPADFKPVVISQ